MKYDTILMEIESTY